MRAFCCFKRISFYRSKSDKLARRAFLAIEVAKALADQAASMPAAAQAFLTVPGRAPQLILTFMSVKRMLLALTSNRPQLPSSTKSLFNEITLTMAAGLFAFSEKTTPPISICLEKTILRSLMSGFYKSVRQSKSDSKMG